MRKEEKSSPAMNQNKEVIRGKGKGGNQPARSKAIQTLEKKQGDLEKENAMLKKNQNQLEKKVNWLCAMLELSPR